MPVQDFSALSDSGRLAAIQGIGLLDGVAEEAFDRLTRLASRLVDAPVALLSVVSAEDQVFKSAVAPPDTYAPGVSTSLDASFCKFAVASGEPLIIDDARTHPLVREERAFAHYSVNAYLGIPLVTEDGYALGTLCVLDFRPREWSTEQIQGLQDLAAIAVAEIETRRSAQQEASQILESITDAFVALDAQWHCTYLNGRAAQLLGRRQEQVIGKRIWDVFPDMMSGAGYHELHRAMREQRAVVYEERHPPSDTWLEIHAYPSGEGLSLFFQDIGDERRAALELEQTRERLSRTLQTVADGLLVVGTDGRITFANPVAERTFEAPAEQIVGSGYVAPERQPVTPEGEPLAAEELPVARVLATGEPVYGRVHGLRLQSGRTVILQVNAAPLAGADTQVAGVVVSFSDITDRVRSEQRQRLLAGASATLASSLDFEVTLREVAHLAVPALADVCSVDLRQPDGALRTVASTREDCPVAGLLRDGDTEGPLAEVLRSHTALLLEEISLQGKPASAIVAPLLARGDVFGVLTFLLVEPGRTYGRGDLNTAEELAHRASVAIENARLFAEAQQASRAKSDFLAVMSHELRTPLNAILGFSDLMLLGVPEPLPVGTIRQVDRIRAAAQHLLEVIEEILTFSRLEIDKEGVRAEPLDLREVVSAAASIAEPLARTRGLEFQTALPDEPVEAVTDAHKVRQVLLNLLGNAVKFTERGMVELSAAEDAGRVRLTVRDTGIGIAPESLERIWEPFQQVEQSMTRTVGGTGLGLTVSRRLARLLGGDVTVQSSPGEGSAFTVWLPRVAPQAEEEPAARG